MRCKIVNMKANRDIRNIQEGRCYHIYNRGNHKDEIAFKQDEFDAYTYIMYEAFSRYEQTLLSYSFMPNHIHMEVKVGDPQSFVNMTKSLNSRLARHYNKTNLTVGHLFQDKYKHRLMAEDFWIAFLSRYIHRNPILKGEEKTTTIQQLIDYPWSSLKYYFTVKPDKKPRCLDTSIVENMFGTKQRYEAFVMEEYPTTFFSSFNSMELIEECNRAIMESLNSVLLFGEVGHPDV